MLATVQQAHPPVIAAMQPRTFRARIRGVPWRITSSTRRNRRGRRRRGHEASGLRRISSRRYGGARSSRAPLALVGSARSGVASGAGPLVVPRCHAGLLAEGGNAHAVWCEARSGPSSAARAVRDVRARRRSFRRFQAELSTRSHGIKSCSVRIPRAPRSASALVWLRFSFARASASGPRCLRCAPSAAQPPLPRA